LDDETSNGLKPICTQKHRNANAVPLSSTRHSMEALKTQFCGGDY
jgi:hypothetical protein